MSNYYWGITSLYAHELGYAPRLARQTLSDTVSWLRSGHAGTPHHGVGSLPAEKLPAEKLPHATPAQTSPHM
jgi:hypothetical protein